MRLRWREFDGPGFLAVLVLMGMGALFLWSVSERPDAAGAASGTEYAYRGTLDKQLMWIGVGLGTYFLALRISSARWSSLAYPAYAAVVISLLGVLVLGTTLHGARRWFSFGGITIQPSEFAKPVMVLALARLLMFVRGGGAGALTKAFVLMSFPVALILLQPDLGTSLLFLPVTVAMAYVGGVRPRVLFGVLLAAGLLVGGGLWTGLKQYRARANGLAAMDRVLGLHAYQWERLASHLEPRGRHASGAFQAQQARIAIGSGGVFGKGIRSGTQSQMKLLPVRKSDFIFAVICEEWGLMGACIVLSAWGYILLGCFATAASAVEPFRRLAAVGLGVLFATEVLLNTGVVTGLLPVTGTPLPLVSQGGSSLVATCLGLGILQSLRMWPGFDLGRTG